MENLTFVRSLSIDAFLNEVGATKVDIIPNPQNAGKLFMATDNGIKGAIGNLDKIKSAGREGCKVSRVSGENGDFWMLHATNHTEAVLSF